MIPAAWGLAAWLAGAGPTLTVVVDPGHGGADHGAVGSSGLREKDVVLEYARALAERGRQEADVRVLLTRDGDEGMGADQRAAFANQAKADVLLSLHADHLAGATLSGVRCWIHRASLPQARRSGGRPVPWGEAQLGVLRDSRRLAEALVAEWDRQGEGPREGTVPEGWHVLLLPKIGQAPLQALRGAAMPAVWVELGFLQLPEEEVRLQEGAWRQAVVEALWRGIRRFAAGR